MEPNRSDAGIGPLPMRRAGVTAFDPIDFQIPRLAWPTQSQTLFSDPARYIARTRANTAYGKPGWTRDCGRRFHRGLDIAPARARPTGNLIEVRFSDCATGLEYPSKEIELIPEDLVFAVLDGTVAVCNEDPDRSDFGLYVVLTHEIGSRFIHTLYAHLADIRVREGASVMAGTTLGAMGRTGRSADARAWMAIAPHLHFEVISAGGGAHDPLEFLTRGLQTL
jgi:murein DD-endopeptidase MepM/ murein hydrolase activator NlpD